MADSDDVRQHLLPLRGEAESHESLDKDYGTTNGQGRMIITDKSLTGNYGAPLVPRQGFIMGLKLGPNTFKFFF